MKKKYYMWLSISLICFLVMPNFLYANFDDYLKIYSLGGDFVFAKPDTTEKESFQVILMPELLGGLNKGNALNVNNFGEGLLEELLIDNGVGVYVTRPTGEPGSKQEIFLRGINKPIMNLRDVYGTQPLIILDGVPLIGDHPFAFDIQSYDLERIGPDNNLLSHINLNDIEEVYLRKDLPAIILYGPLAANGVIEIKSKSSNVSTNKKITVNSYIGFSAKPHVTTINGSFENAFRKQFYDLYTVHDRYGDGDVYPIYLSDSLNRNYFGSSDWTDSFYKKNLNHGVDLSLSGGNKRTKFHFTVGTSKRGGVADDAKIDKYHAKFYLTIKPFNTGMIEAMINANRIDRQRNMNLKNRFSMMGYLPDLSAPLAPNNEVYSNYLKEVNKGFDNNFTNILQGYFRFSTRYKGFSYQGKFAVDYNEGYRDVFYPSTLMEVNNFASNYYGYNQRLFFDQTLGYEYFTGLSSYQFKIGSSLIWDEYKYNNAYAYKGVNDFIKLNLINGDLNPTAFPRQLVYKFLDRTKHNIASFYLNGGYDYNKRYQASLVLRYDGSSNAQPTGRWFMSSVLALGWDIKEEFYQEDINIESFKFKVSSGRLGSTNIYDDFSQGPNYRAQIGYTGNKVVPSYNGIAAIARPYEAGWVGYDIPWSYINEFNTGLDIGFKKHKAQLSIEFYSRRHKDQMLLMPSVYEYGYKHTYQKGLEVQNSGIDLSVAADVYNKDGFNWRAGLNLGVNANKLIALPNNLKEVVIDNRLLKVGERIDSYWLLDNQGIYSNSNDIPVLNGEKMTYNGIEMKAGDPKWVDVNADNKIDNTDRKLLGNILPKLAGSFSNNFKYNRFDLKLDLYFNLGREIINQEMANRFNFIENENANDLNSVKEITYWEKRGDYSKYPLYNPWSSANVYQPEQTLFLENGAFMKVRNISLGYDATNVFRGSADNKNSFYVYISAQNILTFTRYSGRDPELVNIFGYDTGASFPIPKTFTLGFTLNL